MRSLGQIYIKKHINPLDTKLNTLYLLLEEQEQLEIKCQFLEAETHQEYEKQSKEGNELWREWGTTVTQTCGFQFLSPWNAVSALVLAPETFKPTCYKQIKPYSTHLH